MNQETVATAKDEATNVAGTAAEEAKSLAGTAQQEAQSVSQTAKEQLADVAGEAKRQASQLVDQASTGLQQQAETQTQRAAQMLRDYDSEVQALLDGRPQDAPHLVQRLQQGSGQLSGLADRLDQRGPQGLLSDVEDFARRRPGLFLLGCALAGFAATRVLRASKQAQDTPRQLPPAPTYSRPSTVGTYSAPPLSEPDLRSTRPTPIGDDQSTSISEFPVSTPRGG